METRKKRLALAPLLAAGAVLWATAALAGVAKVDGGIEFSYADPYAASVSLAGAFNNWSTNANPMGMDDDGVWRVVVPLAAGKYEYKFVVNGTEWVADPENPRVVGAYGNSEIVVNAAGEPVFEGAAAAISNTPLSARVTLNGWYRGTYDTRSDTPSEPRWRLDRPAHELYFTVNPTVTPQVKGSATLRFNTGEGDIKEIAADFYSGHGTLEGGPFSVTAYYNEERLAFDDPLELLGHIDLPGTITEEHIPFGRGSQGIVGSADVGPASVTAVYANQYDLRILANPAQYDNTDTDILAARAKSRRYGPVSLGATYLSRRDGWWMSWLGTNEDPFLDEYIAGSATPSDWFEYAKTEQWITGDVDWEVVPTMVDFAAELGGYSYAGRWDMGNREKVQGDDYGNGAIDVPTGSMSGVYGKGVLWGEVAGLLTARFSLERQNVDGMSAGDEFIAYDAPPWALAPVRQLTEVRFAGSPLVVNVYGPAPKRGDTLTETDLVATVGIFDVGAEFDYDAYQWTYPESLPGLLDLSWEGSRNRVALHGRVEILPEDLWFELEHESLTYDVDDGPWQPVDTGELIGRGWFGFREGWGVLGDVRRITYSNVMTGDTTSDESFVAPYVAVVWNPRPNIELRLGYGVNPTNYLDTPVEGRGDGRERWRSQYLWENSGADDLGAEKALEDARIIGLMALIAF